MFLAEWRWSSELPDVKESHYSLDSFISNQVNRFVNKVVYPPILSGESLFFDMRAFNQVLVLFIRSLDCWVT